jgi:hypothetical protein
MHPMTLSAIDVIRWKYIIPLALFNWSVITYQGSRAPKGLKDFQHVYKL